MLLPLLFTSVLVSDFTIHLTIEALLTLFLGAPPQGESSLPANLSLVPQLGDWIQGTYSFQSKSGDAAGYLTALGVGYFIRQMALVSRPTIVVDRHCSSPCPPPEQWSECEWSLSTDAGLAQHTINFTLNKEIADTTVDGRTVTKLFSQEVPNQLVEFQSSSYANTTIVRTFFKDRLEVHMAVGDVRAVSVFHREMEERGHLENMKQI